MPSISIGLSVAANSLRMFQLLVDINQGQIVEKMVMDTE